VLYELRLGLDGVITGAACTATCSRESGRAEHGDSTRCVILQQVSPDSESRGADSGTGLYIMKKRGIFQDEPCETDTACLSGSATEITEFKPSDVELAEIDYRFAALSRI